MFETPILADWSRVDALIERMAKEALTESRATFAKLRDRIDMKLGLSQSFIRRSAGQRRRYERQRLNKGTA